MQKIKINFIGKFWEYFGMSIFLSILSLITLGLAFPYYLYWTGKYFVSNLEFTIENK